MTGSTHSLRRRRTATLLAAGAVGALLLAGATACASTGKSVSVSSGGSYSGSASATAGSASPSASPSAGATGSTSAGGTTTASSGGLGAPVITPNAQLSSSTAGTKYTAFDSASHSADGRTLYLGIESQGGACGKYDVVLQQSGTTVSVGLVHLSSAGRMCPMYVTHMLVRATLAAPLDSRKVVDLANGETVASAQIG
ncbi:hypothetical protein KDK95_09480 [Actinospica sp. MGRD01-02]|uniref:Uncharacterized protein n=1 Tax=Actinospica acidithermotolerans TaxID=2828514 RepID=A0A941E9S2_9ACTN|nr:hypothetical protein [Actinospica acidithermotolerans]MBR7826533.1 hypothetical protein [Actinospica acidithermotolerans]